MSSCSVSPTEALIIGGAIIFGMSLALATSLKGMLAPISFVFWLVRSASKLFTVQGFLTALFLGVTAYLISLATVAMLKELTSFEGGLLGFGWTCVAEPLLKQALRELFG